MKPKFVARFVGIDESRSWLIVINNDDSFRRNRSRRSSSVVSPMPVRPAFTSRSARRSSGLCVFALACVNDAHSALFQNHRGTFSGR